MVHREFIMYMLFVMTNIREEIGEPKKERSGQYVYVTVALPSGSTSAGYGNGCTCAGTDKCYAGY